MQENEKSGLLKGEGNILVVDDEEMITISLKLLLSSLGYTVNICKDGMEAVEYYKINWRNIDLVITDMIMPEMNGIDAFQKMKKINPNVKTIMLSGINFYEDAEDALNMGITEIIEKPYTIESLSKKVNDILIKI